MGRFDYDAYDTDEIRLAIAKLLKTTKPQHDFIEQDDRRWFECRYCDVSYSWRQYSENSRKEPTTICYGNNDNYPEDLNAINEILLNRVDEDDMRHYLDFLSQELEEGDFIVTASARQKSNAFVKFKQKYP